MDHKPFPLYMLGERYSVFLSDVGEQVLSKLYKERTDVVVRIKKTYDKEKCLQFCLGVLDEFEGFIHC